MRIRLLHNYFTKARRTEIRYRRPGGTLVLERALAERGLL
jgi:hypothetical protein